ncbi:UDP-N-acetylmuramoylalanyl-D-glutamyl-2,6-diaminopimelate--D-alanyl-D-alanine ligase [uncultured Tateyamaria sp.]|uniref:UDP-N-acetylmuramoylalanyl-D-glutamyl-2, 6-diaminopimelate--D-alanyl-D-alanine ligase n=1 Tax=uncultured Tateyamaria sp. TaxID=455651 RepID=UPI0026326F3F|nr:UDP-N-acetylmuramoylalanyl-D-glutamyl-2,6-diaminopimelate--D-alanyl-D-alanine ligase [uncultured Tateyamaria sp.]
MLWTRDALSAAAKATAIGDWTGVSGISIDTRTLQKGDLFVALKDQRDGHDFAGVALDKDAAAVLVSDPQSCSDGAPSLVADDTLTALENIAAAARGRASDLCAIAVTGSVGKTSVKEALRHVLDMQGTTHASEKSYNNHWGVPLTLARMPADTQYGVFEIGMNHSGEITPLTRMVRPHIAVVTTVAPAHLGNFKDESEIAEAKAEIFSGLPSGGKALINLDNPWSALLSERAKAANAQVIGFGEAAGAEIRLTNLVQQAATATVEADIMGQEVMYRLCASGRHHALNSLAVLGAAVLAGADLARAALSMQSWQPGAGRGARRNIRLDPVDPQSVFLLIDESYNANPVSVRAALETLGFAETGPGPAGRRGRRIAVLGDMLEMGTRADDLHAALAIVPEMKAVDIVYACGPHSRALYDALPASKRGGWAEDSAALAPVVNDAVRTGDALVVKGSLGSRMAKIVDVLCAPRTRRTHA